MEVCLLTGVYAGKKEEKYRWTHKYDMDTQLSGCVQQTIYCYTAISLFMHFLLVFAISWVVDGSHNDIIECIRASQIVSRTT